MVGLQGKNPGQEKNIKILGVGLLLGFGLLVISRPFLGREVDIFIDYHLDGNHNATHMFSWWQLFMATKINFYTNHVLPTYVYHVNGMGDLDFFAEIQRLNLQIITLNNAIANLQDSWANINHVDAQLPNLQDHYYNSICEIRAYESVYSYFNPGYLPFGEYTGEVL
jgi:hypothetical protein